MLDANIPKRRNNENHATRWNNAYYELNKQNRSLLDALEEDIWIQ